MTHTLQFYWQKSLFYEHTQSKHERSRGASEQCDAKIYRHPPRPVPAPSPHLQADQAHDRRYGDRNTGSPHLQANQTTGGCVWETSYLLALWALRELEPRLRGDSARHTEVRLPYRCGWEHQTARRTRVGRR